MLIRYILFLLLPICALSCAVKHATVQTMQEESRIPPKDASYEYILGYLAEKEGNWEDSIAHYKKALRKDPSSAFLKTQISSMLLRTGEVKEATVLAEEILENNPDYVPALMLLGELYNSQKKTDEAIKIYQEVLELQPENEEASLFLSVLYVSLKEYDKAIHILKNLVSFHPDNLMALYYLGLKIF